MPNNPLQFDVMRDLSKVDNFLTKLLGDKETQRRFFYNPARVMIELGFHPATTNKAIGITNRLFYATMANKKLIRYVLETAPKINIPAELREKTIDGLNRGRILSDPKIGGSRPRSIPTR